MNRKGQATFEYMLLLLAIAGFALFATRAMNRIDLVERIMKPIKEDFARTYQHGHPEALGTEDQGGPKKHPRALEPAGSNFRLFVRQKN